MLLFQVGFVFVCLVGWLVVVVCLFVYLSVFFPSCA